MTGRVFHTGQIIIDIAIRVDRVPPPGGDVFGEYAGTHVGGGYNVLYASRQVGVETIYAGTIGRGSFSDIAIKELQGISVSHVGATLPTDLGFCVAITDSTAERTFFSTRGAETQQPLESFDQLTPNSNDVIYITGYSLAHVDNRQALERLASRLGPSTCTTVFDVSPMIDSIPMESLRQIGELSPIWSLNEREATILSRRLEISDDDELGPAHTVQLLAKQLGTVLVRIGSGGTWLAMGDTVKHIPTIEVTPIDTNGAGDAHSGVLCGALAGGQDLSTAIRWANIAGALSTKIMGPATCPTLEIISGIAAKIA